MTVAPPNPSTRSTLAHPLQPRAIDMRCSSAVAPAEPALPVTPRADATARDSSRCQLLAGHDGEHALMYGDGATRRVLAWLGDEVPRTVSDWRSLPWMRGYPFPAWFELDD